MDKVIEGIKEKNLKGKHDKIKKSVVLTAKSLSILNELAKKHSISRDMILDLAFQTMAFLTESSTAKRLEDHKEILAMTNKLYRDAEELEKQAQKILDEDDPVLSRIGSMIVVIMNLSIALENEQKDGIPVNPDEL